MSAETDIALLTDVTAAGLSRQLNADVRACDSYLQSAGYYAGHLGESAYVVLSPIEGGSCAATMFSGALYQLINLGPHGLYVCFQNSVTSDTEWSVLVAGSTHIMELQACHEAVPLPQLTLNLAGKLVGQDIITDLPTGGWRRWLGRLI